ncbi:hypothetical protein AAG570_001769 [Ranatra chinensis]|uniref:C2H2-type domain-containing protein n=1 Tax=Ranatra chinensis TaxID=642074 RepID=A0ABD0YAC4_9HEMI
MEYSCKRCNVSFTDVKKLHQHEQIYHTRKFACLHCNFVSYKLIYMLKHLTESNHTGRVCSICLFESDDSAGMKRHLDDHRHNLPFMCSICSERFKTRTDWSRHSSAHTTDTSYVCKICDMSFKRNSYLHNHVLTHHSEPKHLCELCGYTTPFKSFLTRHKLKHSTKSIACPVENCEFTTAREANLRSHMKTHSAEKAFKCHICNVKFTQDKNLRRHMHLAHNPKATAFQCPGCCYVNSRIDKVKKHIADAHPSETTVMNQFQEKYEAAKRRPPSLLPKYSRSNQNAKERKKATFQPLAQEINSQMGDPLRTDIMQNPTDSTRTNSSKTGGSSMVKQTVLMSEATGEIAIMSIQEGQPIPVASLTSTSLLTIGNFREGTGSVTLNETTGVLTLNNINSESTGAVFLNESTGELSYINLNQESRQVEERPDKIQTDMSYDVEFSTLLNEETGEISTVQEQSDRVNNLCEDDMFDSFDIDAFNEDSFDCFDEFDGYLFDSFNPSGGGGGENEPTIENFLNEFTGELLKESSPLDNNTIVSGQSGKDIWDPVCSLEPSLGLGDMFSETKLNEFTGEFV